MKTEITNLLSGEKTLFINDLSLTDNIINAIICDKKQTGNLLDTNTRQAIKEKYPIREYISTITGRPFAYCESFDLLAKHL